ncbi:MAG: LptF/LptG family permease, partial [Deltaproteobacteria bacterium]|nr:LptF/LptG family permease [Deltaproteobacteria bacterium]
MTNKLNLYILTEFLKILGLTLLSIVVISLLINIVDSAGDFIEKKVPLGETALYYMLKVPEIFCLVLPIATLLSVLITLGIFNSNSEITAIKACGIGIMEALTPLFAFGILISIVSFVITESAVPPAQRAIVDIEKRWFSKLHHDHFGKSGYWFKTDSIFLNVKNFNMDKNIAEGVNIFEFDSSFKLSKKIDAKV